MNLSGATSLSGSAGSGQSTVGVSNALVNTYSGGDSTAPVSLNSRRPRQDNSVNSPPGRGSVNNAGIGQRIKLALKNHQGLQVCCKNLADNLYFTVGTTGLTLYALFGDDIRLSSTNKDTDIVFNVLTLMCLAVFCLEILVNSIGKDGYFMGFFFVLDVVSTASLILDLTWVSEELFGNSSEDDANGDNSEARQLRAGRAGRVGARAGRVVRIIRLIRLVKLYKHAVEHRARADQHLKGPPTRYSSRIEPGEEKPRKSEKKSDRKSTKYGDDDDEDEEEMVKKKAEEEAVAQPESRVGEKLSFLITRRVIILVLIMLFCLPQFASSGWSSDFAPSAQYGADMVYRRWVKWCQSAQGGDCVEAMKNGTFNVATEIQSKQRKSYEISLVTYIYHHNWFSKEDGHCSDDRCTSAMYHLFWIGVSSQVLQDSEENLKAEWKKSDLGLAHVQQFIPTKVKWDEYFGGPNNLIDHGSIPRPTQQKIARPWRTRCGSLVGLSLIDDEDPPIECPNRDLRYMEFEYYTPETISKDEKVRFQFYFAYDKRPFVKMEAGLNSVQTVFICIVLGVAALMFSKDSNELVLHPIERMVAKMRKIRDDPLQAMRLGDEEYKREEIEREQRKREMLRNDWRSWYRKKTQKVVREPMETVILERTIIKLGGLLALGFGEAGAEIIGQNMKSGDTAGVDAMTAGQKVDAIFGFCNIQNFTDATEILKDKVMIFVNQIGEIVHGCVDDYHGAPNKNIGDAFLLVWRLSGIEEHTQRKLADMAMISFVKMVAELNKSPVLAEYRGHPGFLQRIPNYRVRMGFGMHYGWAIEGAIGSNFKIDASYLSPNVNMASRLEAATAQFGVPILISHCMIDLCSDDMKAKCRKIDNVTVKGSKQPIKLYVIDLDYLCLDIEIKSMHNVVKNRFKVRQLREARKATKWADDFKPAGLFKKDVDILKMRMMYVPQFFARFDMAYRNYEAGQWLVAKAMLQSTQYMLQSPVRDEPTEDGPSTTLLSYMREFDYVAPPGWPGYRELTSK